MLPLLLVLALPLFRFRLEGSPSTSSSSSSSVPGDDDELLEEKLMPIGVAVGGGWVEEEGITGNVVACCCWEGIAGIVGVILKDEMGIGLLNPIETGLGDACAT